MRSIAAFLILSSALLGQDPNSTIEQNSTYRSESPRSVEPAPVVKAPAQSSKYTIPLVPTVKKVTPAPIVTLTYEQKLDLHDAMHEGDNIDRSGHWSFPGDIDSHLVGHPDKRPVKALDVEPLRNGKYSFIVIESSDEEFYAWSNRAEVESRGWAIVRQPKRSRLASAVVIGKRIFRCDGHVTNAFLSNCVSTSMPALSQKPASGLKITMITRANCSWCDKWMASEYPKAIAAGVQVEFKTSNSGSVPRFEVCGADGQCRLFTGFTSFETMGR